MKLAAISMIRDEADIIVPFLRHLAAIFDVVYLLDQRSSDGSEKVMRDACAANSHWHYHYMDFAGRYQGEVYTLFMAKAFESGADMVFFIDSDEFAALDDRQHLVEAAHSCNERGALGLFHLRACVPTTFTQWPFDPSAPLWILKRDSSLARAAWSGIRSGPWRKIAVPRCLFDREPGLAIAQGSHSVVTPTENEYPYLDIGYLLHLPIRTHQQAVQKIFLSAIANLAKNNQMQAEGRHKRQLLKLVADDELSEVRLASIAAQYPPVEDIVWLGTVEELRDWGFSLERLRVPMASLLLDQPAPSDPSRILARCLSEFQQERLKEEGSLELHDGIVRFMPREVPISVGARLEAERDLRRLHAELKHTHDKADRMRTKLESEIRQMRHSTSWRVTAPLRAASNAIYKLFSIVFNLRRGAS